MTDTNALAVIDNTPATVVDREAILRHLKLNPRDPATQALLLVCDRYSLDPLLKHMVLIQGTPYITRDGYLAVAHRSGMFDGIEVVDQGKDQTHWWAKVSVYRKDWGRPTTYIGRYPLNGSNKTHGPEMAIKCAEVMALRRAFNVTGAPAADEAWDAIDVSGEELSPAELSTGSGEASTGPAPSDTAPLSQVNPQAYQKRKARAHALGGELGLDHDALHDLLGCSFTEATADQFTALIVGLQERQEAEKVTDVEIVSGGGQSTLLDGKAVVAETSSAPPSAATYTHEDLVALVADTPQMGESRAMSRAAKIARDRGENPPSDFAHIAGDVLQVLCAELNAGAPS